MARRALERGEVPLIWELKQINRIRAVTAGRRRALEPGENGMQGGERKQSLSFELKLV